MTFNSIFNRRELLALFKIFVCVCERRELLGTAAIFDSLTSGCGKELN